ncbi:MAG: MFS transporter [Opitutaceae bacterium]|nr:MFS transporter [Opitutaceae bacterium]
MPTPATVMDPNEKLRWPEKVGYGVGDTASCLFWVLVSSYLSIFYTDVFGLAPAALTVLFLVTRIWDAAFDLVMGMIADRTQTRWGKYRPWILWGIIPFMAAEIALFYTPNLSDSGKLVYAYLTYSATMFLYSVLNVPYGALLGVISARSEERTVLASYRFVGAFAGNFIIQSSLLYLVHKLGSGNDRQGYLLAVTLFACVSGALFFCLFASTKERVQAPPEKTSIKGDLKDLIQNKPWLILFSVGVLTLIYVTLRQASSVYYLKYYVNREDLVPAFMAGGTIFSILGALASPYLVRFFGCKKRTFIILTVFGAALTLYNYIATPTDLVTVFICHYVVSIPLAAIFPIMGSMFADTADYGEWKFGRRATGLIFAGQTFSQKTGGAIGAAVVTEILALAGYVANTQQSEASLSGLRHLMTTLPGVIGLLVVGLALLYTLDAKRASEVAEELASRRSSS